MPYLLLRDALVIGKIERKKNSKPFIRITICAFQKSTPFCRMLTISLVRSIINIQRFRKQSTSFYEFVYYTQKYIYVCIQYV